jgi:hypothetical protein
MWVVKPFPGLAGIVPGDGWHCAIVLLLERHELELGCMDIDPSAT